jgi:predicted DNA-binding transcriptional regulator AlpA
LASEELLSLKQLLAELGEGPSRPLAESTFYDWRAKNRAPRCIKLPNGSLRFRRRDITLWLNSLEEAA